MMVSIYGANEFLRCRALTIALVATAVLSGCGSPVSPTPSGTASAPTSASAEGDGACTLTLGAIAQPAAAGGTFSVPLRATCFWTAVSDQPWLTTSARPSLWSGNETIVYVVTANNTTSPRTGRITVANGDTTTAIAITQPGVNIPCAYAVSPNAQSIPDEGGSFTVGVTAGCGWTASVDQPWLTIGSGASGSGNATIAYTVSANTGAAGRTGHITVSGSGGSTVLTVNQSFNACTYVVPDPASVSPAGGDAFTVSLMAGCAWTATSDQPWLTIVSAASGSGNAAIRYAVAANTGPAARTGHIMISGEGGSVQFRIDQGFTPCAYELAFAGTAVPPAGGSFTVTFTAGCAWTVSSDQSWLTITSPTSGSGNAAIAYAVSSNTGSGARTGHITVSGNGGSVQFTVDQPPTPPCAYALSPASATVAASGGNFTVSLSAGCAWTVSSDEPGWLSIASASSGSGDATIRYTVFSLNGPPSRTGHITVRGDGGTAQLTVTQNPPASVTFTVSPNPVPWSGQPVDRAPCIDVANTWFYDERFMETTGIQVHFTRRLDALNGSPLQDIPVDLTVPAGGTFTNPAFWCFTPDGERTIQTTFTGTDANGNAISASGPVVTLQSRGNTF
jgi:Viral BACON domain/Putative binding domain, N-terminal